MNDLKVKDTLKVKRPTIWGLAGYAAVIIVLGLVAIFSRQLAQGIKGPILCIYVAVLPKYIFGLALILMGVDGIVYAVRFFKDDLRIPMIASGIQTVALIIFLTVIFPLSIKEGVPVGSTYNIMRILIGVMLLVTGWDFGKEITNYQKSKVK